MNHKHKLSISNEACPLQEIFGFEQLIVFVLHEWDLLDMLNFKSFLVNLVYFHDEVELGEVVSGILAQLNRILLLLLLLILLLGLICNCSLPRNHSSKTKTSDRWGSKEIYSST